MLLRISVDQKILVALSYSPVPTHLHVYHVHYNTCSVVLNKGQYKECLYTRFWETKENWKDIQWNLQITDIYTGGKGYCLL